MKHFLHLKRAVSVLLLALLMPLTTWAQGSFTVFDGTETNQFIPAYIYYFDQYTKSQVIFPAESLAEMNGQTITEIKFYTKSTNVPCTTNCDADVYLKEVSYSELNAYVSKEDATIVYSGQLSIVAADGGGEMTIQLEEPFIYNGGNLIIGIENTSKGQWTQITFLGTSYGTETGISIAGYSDNSPDDVPPTNRSFRPKTSFSYMPYDPNFLYKPNHLTLDQCGGTEATVSWTSTETNFDIMVNEAVTENVSNPYTITGLQLATTYEVKVRAKRGNKISDWSNPITFTTALSDDLCTIRLDLTDSYGDGWNGAAIKVVDVLTGTVIAQVTNDANDENEPTTVYASVPNLREIKFVWQSGSYDSECSWIIYDTSGDVLFSGNWINNNDHSGTELGSFTVNCNAVPKPTDLQASSITNNSAVISWTQEGDVASWIVAYKADSDADFTEVTASTNSYTLTGLMQETTYTVKVSPVMAGGTLKWSDEITFTTQGLVPKPTEVNITDINWNSAQVNWNGIADSYDIRYKIGLAGGTTTTDFDDSDFDGWTTIDADGDGWDWQIFSTTTYLTGAPGTGDGYNYSEDHVTSGSYRNIGNGGEILYPDNYLVSPMITFGGTISFWACAQDAGYPEEHFGVAVSTTVNDDPDAFITIWENDMTAAKQRMAPRKTGPRKAKGNWYYYEIDLSGFTGTGYVAIRHFNCEDKFLLDIDDITIVQPDNDNPWITAENVTGNNYVITDLEQTTAYTVEVRSNYGTDVQSSWTNDVVFTTAARYPSPTNLQADEVGSTYAVLSWTSGEESQTTWDVAYKALTDDDYTIVTVTDNPYTLSELQSETDYFVRVRGNYGSDGVGAWSNYALFTTLPNIKIFVTDGNWNNDDNWQPVGVPDTNDDVIVRAHAIIPDGVIADVKNVTVESGSITIKDGGQFKSITDNVPMVLEKDINAEQFYLITMPLQELIGPDNVPNCLTGNYNLYQFSFDNQDEWRNYKYFDFDFELGNGYLYSNGDNVTLLFEGNNYASKDNVLTFPLNYSETSDYFSGWMLVGNIYTCNATLTFVDDTDSPLDVTFYKMNDEGTAYEMYETAVVLKPGEAAFMQINQAGTLVFLSENTVTPNYLGESTIPVLPEIDMYDGFNKDATPVTELADDADNSDVLDALNGKTGAHVSLVGRKLWRDGEWNTLCLPFDLQIASSVLADAEEIRSLNSASFSPETHVLTLNFNDPIDTADPAATLSTGVPYIVKWANTNDCVENPVFKYVTVSNAEPVNTEINDVISFIGTYKPVIFDDGDKSILFMGEGSMLYYPAHDAYVNAFRAYFKLADGLHAGDLDSGIKGVVVNFGDGESTGIFSLEDPTTINGDWYTIQGIRLNERPTQKGIYIVNGKKVFIK